MKPLIEQLKARRAKLEDEARAIHAAVASEERDFTDAERTRDDEIIAQIQTLTGDITRAASIRQQELDAPALPDSAPSGRITDIQDRELGRAWGEQWRARGASEKTVQYAAFGEHLIAVRRAALGQGVDRRLMDYAAAAQGAGEAIDADGGFLVEKTTSTDIMLTVTGGEVMRRVDSIPLGPNSNGLTTKMVNETSRATGSRFGAVRGYWLDEGDSLTASRPKLREITLKLRKLGALGYASDELLEDAPAFGAIMTRAFGEELRFLAEDSVFNGDGSNKPLGVIGHAATVSVAKETGQAASTVTSDNIEKMWSRLVAPARAGAVWFINQDVEPQLLKLSHVVGTGGVPVFLPPGGLADSPLARLMGRPIIPVEYCATLGTVGDIVLANLDWYAWITKGGVREDASMHVAFTTDEMAFRAILRVDGQPKWAAALTPFKGTNTLSPIVTLATRA